MPLDSGRTLIPGPTLDPSLAPTKEVTEMSDTRTEQVVVPEDIPPAWANSLMKWALGAPVIEKWVGKEVAVLSFTGRRTGAEYEIPVSYFREDDTVTVITKRRRTWWHNFETPTQVRIRLAGEDYTGMAEIVADETEVLDFMVGYLDKRPIDAKAYGLGTDEIITAKVAKIVPQIVMIRITLKPV